MIRRSPSFPGSLSFVKQRSFVRAWVRGWERGVGGESTVQGCDGVGCGVGGSESHGDMA